MPSVPNGAFILSSFLVSFGIETPVPEWLRKRVAEQNDTFKQRSLGMWLRKAPTRCADDDLYEGKRKIGDLEDLADSKLAPVDFGAGPKKWLEVQRLRWTAGASKSNWQSSLFDTTSAWSSMPAEVLYSTWHILAIEPSTAPKTSADLKVGDTVMAEIPIDHMDDFDSYHPEESTEQLTGTVLGFVAGMVRLMLDSGEEQIVKRSAVKPIQDAGIFSLWVASGPGLDVHRCEVVARRHVILALESELKPEEALREVRPADLAQGLQVQSRSGNLGVVNNGSPELGLCSVTWRDGSTEAVFCKELMTQNGHATKVNRDAPRNLQHQCMVERGHSKTRSAQRTAQSACVQRIANAEQLGVERGGWLQLGLEASGVCKTLLAVRLAELAGLLVQLGLEASRVCKTLLALRLAGLLVQLGLEASKVCKTLLALRLAGLLVIQLGLEASRVCKTLLALRLAGLLGQLGLEASRVGKTLLASRLAGLLVQLGLEANRVCKTLLALRLAGLLVQLGLEASRVCKTLLALRLAGLLGQLGLEASGVCKTLLALRLAGLLVQLGLEASGVCKTLLALRLAGLLVQLGLEASGVCKTLLALRLAGLHAQLGLEA
ncbi:unnamed protein product [Effrenium voratum]|uniref:Uncharacterized protein n=1 Tax=Effrenium voratum TaxID=2562239 RepID=A0AA36NEE2_9DINO|nr:unnamed protein product [Effrenium voratum]